MPLHTAIRRFVSKDGQWWTNAAIIKEKVHVYAGRTGSETIDFSPTDVQGSVVLGRGRNSQDDIAFVCQKLIDDGYREIVSHPKTNAKSTLNKTWYAIESWLDAHVPVSSEWPLACGAEPGELKALESSIGVRLPKDVRDSYLRHNGSNGMQLFRFICGGHWSPLSEIADDWKFFQEITPDLDPEANEPIGPIKRIPMSDKWIPFADNHNGDHLCIDLDPPSKGVRGQVFSYWHEYGAWQIVAPNFETMMKNLLKHLKKGNIIWKKRGELEWRRRRRDVSKQIELFRSI